MGQRTLFMCYLILFLLLNYNYGIAKKMDLTFLIDTTAGITQDEFREVIEFIHSVINSLTIGENNTMVAAVTFNSLPTTQFNLFNYTEKTPLLSAIKNLDNITLNGVRNTHLALNHLTSFVYAPYSRNGADSVVVLLTYGLSADSDHTQFAAFFFASTVDSIYTIGIGEENNELNIIASNPDEEFVYQITHTADLCNYVPEFTEKLDNNSDTSGHHCPTTDVSETTTGTTISTFTNSITTNKEASTSETTSSSIETIVTSDIGKTTSSESTDSSTSSTSATTLSLSFDITTTSTTSVTSLTESTTPNVTKDSHTSPISSDSSDESVVFVVIALMVLIVIVAIAATLFGVLYLPKYRKKKKMKLVITLVVSHYPESRNGLGPSRQRYTEQRQVYKNGHSQKFHTFLKLSMMSNGVRTVSR